MDDSPMGSFQACTPTSTHYAHHSNQMMCSAHQADRTNRTLFWVVQEAFAAKAFSNNYGRPIIGWPDDFERLGRREVRLEMQTPFSMGSLMHPGGCKLCH